MEAKGIEALKARFAGIEVKANPKTLQKRPGIYETSGQAH